jgi:hypothetical protein
MTFKANWEKTAQQFQLFEETIQAMGALGMSKQLLTSHKVISEECANLNSAIDLLNESKPLF